MKRLSPREMVVLLLDALEVESADFDLDLTQDVISLWPTKAEWAEIGKRVQAKRLGVNEIAEAWRQLPPHVWQDEHWAHLIALPMCQFASDFESITKSEKQAAP